jgi:hypothetical protein
VLARPSFVFSVSWVSWISFLVCRPDVFIRGLEAASSRCLGWKGRRASKEAAYRYDTRPPKEAVCHTLDCFWGCGLVEVLKRPTWGFGWLSGSRLGRYQFHRRSPGLRRTRCVSAAVVCVFCFMGVFGFLDFFPGVQAGCFIRGLEAASSRCLGWNGRRASKNLRQVLKIDPPKEDRACVWY